MRDFGFEEMELREKWWICGKWRIYPLLIADFLVLVGVVGVGALDELVNFLSYVSRSCLTETETETEMDTKMRWLRALRRLVL